MSDLQELQEDLFEEVVECGLCWRGGCYGGRVDMVCFVEGAVDATWWQRRRKKLL